MKKTRRRNYFIDKKFQTKFIVKFCIILLGTSLLIGALFIYFADNSTTVAIENTKVVVKRTSDFMMPIMIQTLIIVTMSSAVSVIILTLFTSHKIAGPLYRIKKEIDVLKEGDLTSVFRIRSKDQLKSLVNSISDLADVWRGKHSLLKEKVSDIKQILNSDYNADSLQKRIRELDDILRYFKT